jgi:UDP-N-acetylmuramoylalanine--D-glutamate ligase
MTESQSFTVAGKRVVVVGAARSGVAAAELLVRRGAHVVLTDTKTELAEQARLQDAGIALELGAHRPETMAGADLIVVSPGVPLRQAAIEAARAAGVRVIGEVELASRWVRGRIVAITGTKGKSTTTTLTGRMFDAAGRPVLVGGNIGQALSAQVDGSNEQCVHVVEVSSFQLETIERFHPWIAVLLNVSPDHLDRHASVEEYADAKARIFLNQTETDWAVINADDPATLALARRGRARQFRFARQSAIDEGIVISGDAIAHRSDRRDLPLVPLSAVRLLGPHLLSDVMAATAVGRLAGLPAEAMTQAVESFTGLEHALERVDEIQGVRFVNDSKATNIAAAGMALQSFPDGVIVILGGRFKGGDFRDLREPLAARASGVVAIGEARPLIREALGDIVPVREADTMADAVRAAFGAASPGQTVLLAPACASFDMFRDYAERGRVFKQEVARLAADVRARRES